MTLLESVTAHMLSKFPIVQEPCDPSCSICCCHAERCVCPDPDAGDFSDDPEMGAWEIDSAIDRRRFRDE